MRKILLIILLILFVGAIYPSVSSGQAELPLQAQEQTAPQEPQEQYDVALLKSDRSLSVFTKYGEWEQEGAENALKALQLKYKVITDDELDNSDLSAHKLIIITNARCMSAKSGDNLRRYLQAGGKLFACYLSGYRDEENRLVGSVNDFHINDMLGVSFYQWTNKPPKCEYLEISGELKDFKDGFVQLARNTAVLVKPHEGSKILAYFLNLNKTDYSNLKDYSAAIVMNKDGNVIYSGENLFTPENSSSGQVKKLIAVLINQLVPNLLDLNNEEIYKSNIVVQLPVKPEIQVSARGPMVRILINTDCDKICLSAEDKMVIKENDSKGEVIFSAEKGEIIQIQPIYVYDKDPYIALYNQNKNLLLRAEGDIYVESAGAERIINLVKLNDNDTYSLKSYRGNLKIKQNKEHLNCYNYLSIEEYTAGVVPNEVPYFYPAEALKTMAVVARTFALSNLKRHNKEGYDVCPTVHCQVYEGAISESNETNDAVNKTAGEYIEYDGKYAYATFHSNCGGVLEDVQNVWGSHDASAYLRASFDQAQQPVDMDLSSHENFKNFIDNPPDSFCKDIPRYRWKEKYTKDELKKLLDESLPVLLSNKNAHVGELLDMQIIGRTSHGRAQVLKIIGTGGIYILRKDNMRWMTTGGRISTGGLQSTLFYIEKDGDNYVICGGGWGHGVGMCQSGACGMAKVGYTYKDIIKHYYEGVEIVNGE